jgi:hypothetical protein
LYIEKRIMSKVISNGAIGYPTIERLKSRGHQHHDLTTLSLGRCQVRMWPRNIVSQSGGLLALFI